MEAITPQRATTASEDRSLLLGGDRFYMVARWLILMLLVLTSGLLSNEPLWPPLSSTEPVLLLIWVYALLNIASTTALFLRPRGTVRVFSFASDVLIITLLVFLRNAQAELFYPLYFVPLIGAAIQMSASTGLVFGVAAAVMYTVAFLVPLIGPGNGVPPRDALGLVALGLRAATLVFIPWLTGGLVERTTLANRKTIDLAERSTQHAWGEANVYRDQMRSLYEVAYTLSTTMNYQSVLDTTLLESRKLVPHTVGMVLLSTGNPDELYIAAAYGLSESDRAQTVTISSGQLGNVLRSHNPSLIDDVCAEAEFASLGALHACRAACVVPLRAGLRTYGALLIAGDQTTTFTDENLGMITALANYAIIALHNAQLVHDLREERSKLISKEEEVRHQLARDLHDGPAQALAAMAMNVEFIKRLLERDAARVPSELDKLSALARRTTHEVRTMLFELRPLALETQGLDTTLRQYFERFQSNTTAIVLEAEAVDVNLDTKVEATLFNIIQESVNNALKHAEAKHIWVRVKQTSAALETTIQDDGRGFDMQKVLASYEQRGSFGLLNIDERAKLIGGLSEMHSAPGQGTTVRVIIPLNQ